MFFTISAGFVTQAHAEMTCPPQPQSTINVKWNSRNIAYDFSKSQDQMDRMENDTVNPYGAHVETHVGGLMNGGISIQSQIQVATLNYPRARQICQWLDRMDISITIEPKILIAREHKNGSCQHKAILDHEMKHVIVDRDVVRDYSNMIEDRMKKAARDIGIVGPKDEADKQKFQDKISRYLETELKKISDEFYAERRKRQQAIDSREEYDRVAAVCG